MFLLIDNYDSFTYNLLHFMSELGVEMEVYRNDAISADAALALKPRGIVISPGPCDPDKAGICLDLISKAAGHVPVFGVCLGHQSIGQTFGGRVVRAPEPRHGKVSQIRHNGQGIFAGIANPFTATRYHSLMVAREDLPECFEVTAESDDGVIQGLSHKDWSIHGVQFHPESIASESGHAILKNFIEIAAEGPGAKRGRQAA